MKISVVEESPDGRSRQGWEFRLYMNIPESAAKFPFSLILFLYTEEEESIYAHSGWSRVRTVERIDGHLNDANVPLPPHIVKEVKERFMKLVEVRL